MKQRIITTNSAQTQKIGEKLAEKVFKTKPLKTALIVGLNGDLGSGKTTFLQGFARGLGVKEKILSPTFVIMKKFKVFPLRGISRREIGFKFQEFYHIDCYRVKKLKEILELGFKEIISDPKNIVVIEWADKIKKILSNPSPFKKGEGSKKTIFIDFKFIAKNKREILFCYKNLPR